MGEGERREMKRRKGGKEEEGADESRRRRGWGEGEAKECSRSQRPLSIVHIIPRPFLLFVSLLLRDELCSSSAPDSGTCGP